MINIKEFVDSTINEFINETFQSKLETEYTVIENRDRGIPEYVYEFKTNSGTEYCLEFICQLIKPTTKIDRKNKISKITKNLTKAGNKYFCIEIGFSTKDNFNNDNYLNNTNKNEPFELLSRIGYLVDIYQRKFPNIKMYTVSTETNSKKINIYRELYKNIFASNFKMMEGDYENNRTGALYFINYNNLI